MAEITVSQVVPMVNGSDMKFIENNGQILFSSEEIGRQLGYKHPAKSINVIFSRNIKELRTYAVGIKLMSTDGKLYEVRHFTEEGVYILSMLASTPRAQEFRARLASLLRQIRERRVQVAYQRGIAEARSLPALEADRKAAYLSGMQEGTRLQKRRDGLKRLVKIRRCVAAGLTYREVGAALGMTSNAVQKMLARARKAGLCA